MYARAVVRGQLGHAFVAHGDRMRGVTASHTPEKVATARYFLDTRTYTRAHTHVRRNELLFLAISPRLGSCPQRIPPSRVGGALAHHLSQTTAGVLATYQINFYYHLPN